MGNKSSNEKEHEYNFERECDKHNKEKKLREKEVKEFISSLPPFKVVGEGGLLTEIEEYKQDVELDDETLVVNIKGKDSIKIIIPFKDKRKSFGKYCDVSKY